MKTLKDELNIVKDLPSHLNSLDFKEIGSLVCNLFNFSFDCISQSVNRE